MRNKIILTGILLFFFGFPVAGLLYFWADMQSKVEASAGDFVDEVGRDVLAKWDYDMLANEGTMTLKTELKPERFEGWKQTLGKFKEIGSLKNKKTWALPRNDMMWQFTSFDAPVEFEKGTATLRATVTRKTIGPRWRFETFELIPNR